ncbi:hypothetical protein [Capnocytophaga sputigena]|uniref:hypothetical protein n=1 Tax=Capnocytophaga sputigena TaxID=1019 RepID=UPI0028D41281|nr:hypothetical protein [Capnocytophaga sputigena]
MSVIAKLYFDGGERTLLSYKFQANKSLGSNGRPTFLKEMVFNVSFYPEKGDEFFYRWVLNKSEEPQRVKIVLYDIVWKRVVEQHEIIYSTGVQFHSEFDHQLGTINRLKIPALTLISNEIYYTDIRFGVHHFGEIERQKKKQQQEDTPKIINGFWTNLNDTPIQKAVVGDKVRFHIRTENFNNQEEVTALIYNFDSTKEKRNDKLLTSQKTIFIEDNKGFIEWEIKSDECLSLFEERGEGDSLELYVKCSFKKESIDLPTNKNNYLVLEEKEEVVTILIEIPHSEEKGIARKGLAGHTGIIIGEEYYDFGPVGGKVLLPFTKGGPWWDTDKSDIVVYKDEYGNQRRDIVKLSNLTKNLILDILSDDDKRKVNKIFGEVYLIDIHIKQSEKNKLEEWWKDKYENFKRYSLSPINGKQCTTIVKTSLRKCTKSLKKITLDQMTTLTPKGFLELLKKEGVHTSGDKKGQPLTISEKYDELPLKQNSKDEKRQKKQNK